MHPDDKIIIQRISKRMHRCMYDENLPGALQNAYYIIDSLKGDQHNQKFMDALRTYQIGMERWRTKGYHGLPAIARFVDPNFLVAYFKEKNIKNLLKAKTEDKSGIETML